VPPARRKMSSAAVVADGDEAEGAARLLGAGQALLEQAAATLEPTEGGLAERTLATLRNRLGEARLEAVCENGRKLSAEDAVALALDLAGE
jgi:hypothetical protein